MDRTLENSTIYQSAAARVALMYRLPTATGERKTLLLTVPGKDIASPEGWDGEVSSDYVGYDCDNLRRHADASFDRVVLHWVLGEFVGNPGRRRAAVQQRALIGEARRLLRPGGVLTGCVPAFLAPVLNLRRPCFGWTGGRCAAMLSAHGFDQIRLSTILPSADMPRTILSRDGEAASDYFRTQLARAGDPVSPTGRLIRRLFIELGVTAALQGSLAFSGRVPC